MKTYQPKAVSTMILVSGAIAIGAESNNQYQNQNLIDNNDTHEIITEMAKNISQNYVYPDKGDQVSEMLLTNLEKGEYDGLVGRELAGKIHEELRTLTKDLHFGFRALPEGWQPPSQGEDSGIRPGPSAPFGFNTVERLNGNIGYIDLRGFNQAEAITETVDAAMRLIQGSSSIIFDLRRNGGGDPNAVALISSYLFEPSESVHLNSLYSRPRDETTEYWTHANIDTTLAMPDTPIYVLTSNQTFSAAEEFTYNLKNLERATIIGEITGGGAHPVDQVLFHSDETDRHYLMIIPTAKAVSPITGTNWEGVGVKPDIAVDADDALDTAISAALQVAYENGDESARWGLASINARLDPLKPSTDELNELAGTYGQRHVSINGDHLQYKRDGISSEWRKLICVEKDHFVIEDFEGFIMEFQRDDDGKIIGIAGHYQRGDSDFSSRDS
jgi:retinol-binding protein 3